MSSGKLDDKKPKLFVEKTAEDVLKRSTDGDDGKLLRAPRKTKLIDTRFTENVTVKPAKRSREDDIEKSMRAPKKAK